MTKRQKKPTTIAGVPIVALPIAELRHLKQQNPNKMGPDRYELLKKVIKEEGFLQPILVYHDGDSYVLIDGEHRIKACDELGITEVPAVVARSEESARILRLAMNKLRGEMDVTLVGQELLDLSDTYDVEELTTTGYMIHEINALIEMASEVNEDDILSGAPLGVEDDVRPKTYNLTLKFSTESDRARVREFMQTLGHDTLEEAALAMARGTG